MKKYIAACALLFLLITGYAKPCSAGGESASSMFQYGNDAYKGGNYQKARECYEKILNDGYVSPSLYYNLGNTCFKENRPGWALLYYEKAHRLAPRDRDITYNLGLVRDALAQSALYSSDEHMMWFKGLCTINECTVLVSVLYFAFMALLISYVFYRQERFFWVLCTTGFLLLCFSIMLGTAVYDRETLHYGIVVAPSAEVRSGPSYKENVTSIIPEGCKVRIIRKEGEWVEISVKARTSKDEATYGKVEGWIPDKDQSTI